MADRQTFEGALRSTLGQSYSEATRTKLKHALAVYADRVPTEDLKVRLPILLGLSENVVSQLLARLRLVNKRRLGDAEMTVFSETLVRAAASCKEIVPQVPLMCAREKCVKCAGELAPRAVWPQAWSGKTNSKKKGLKTFCTRVEHLQDASVYSYARRCNSCGLEHYYDHARGNGEYYMYDDWETTRFILGIGRKAHYYEVADISIMNRLMVDGKATWSASAEAFDAVAAKKPFGQYTEVARKQDVYKRKQIEKATQKALVLFWEAVVHDGP